MPTVDELIARYPLRLLPVRGRHEMFVWYTHNDGHHAILASDEARAVRIFGQAVRKYGAEPTEYWRIEIVAPPHSYVERVAKSRHENVLQQFATWVLSVVDDVFRPWHNERNYLVRSVHREEMLSRFGGLRRCPYVAPEWFTDEETTDEDREEARRSHTACQGFCFGEGFLPADGTWEDFWESRRMAMGECETRRTTTRSHEFADRSSDPTRPILSNLPPSDPARPLYVVSASFGHHSLGLVIKQVMCDEISFGDELFFFQGEKLDVPAVATEMIARTRKDREAREKEREAREEERWMFARLRRFDEFVELFPREVARARLLALIASRGQEIHEHSVCRGT